ncbi:hypothetical protein PBI_SQUIRTY_33 [Mycobacterium phage Squirty]|uniref:DUF2510 domain-containing protein n=1 Tax=Mycobacterium phage Squirty TaxID=1527512 RepID=A0A088F7R2_9CAUD|nr:DUF2510 domain-containing protein [Mycobacterium phage Squirty]AIM40980.1 hypothetical protein PBI_SQUIRTY_33 [Mycobacterium phage Squirty]
MENVPPSPPPGWYPDPAGSGGQRYWDGQRWTEHYAPRAVAAQIADRRFTVNYGFALLAFFSLLATVGLPLLAMAGGAGASVGPFAILWMLWGGMWTLVWTAFAIQHTLRNRR